ncbi:MAG: CHRD domain-containing protein [Deferrisomatales bacterium]
MRRTAISLGLAALLAAGAAGEARAALGSFGPVSLSHGYPIWYEDLGGLRLQLCLNQDETLEQPLLLPGVSLTSGAPQDLLLPAGSRVLPCLTGEPFAGRPISFPFNFGGEAFWWSADTFTTFATSHGPGNALLVAALEGGFLNGFVNDGEQIAFARIRLRITVPVPGLYTVSHPFGQATYDVQAVIPGVERTINETQDVGILVPLDFAAALGDGPVPAELPLPGEPPVPPLEATCIPGPDPDPRSPCVAEGDASIGPFLTQPGDPLLPPRVNLNGRVYLSIPNRIDPVTGLVQALPVAIAGGVAGQNFFRLQFAPNANSPGGFQLNPGAADPNAIQLNEFTLSGRVFNRGANLAPVAVADRAAGAADTAIAVSVLANDTDPVVLDPANPFDNPANTNVYGIDPGAIAIPAGPGFLRGTTTAKGGTVSRQVTFTTGQAFFSYLPPAGFTGVDAFPYVVQDEGGLVSAPALAAVVVERTTVDRAVFHPKLMKWTVEGTCTTTEVEGPVETGSATRRATLTGGQVLPLSVATPARGTAAFAVNEAHDAVAFTVEVTGLPAGTSITGIHVRRGTRGESGPVVWNLAAGSPVGPVAGTLTPADLPGGGFATFAGAVDELLAGRMFLQVTTTANPSGELRGLIGVPNTMTVRAGATAVGRVVGTAEVRPDGTWRLQRDALVSPGEIQSVSVVSGYGVGLLDRPLAVR